MILPNVRLTFGSGRSAYNQNVHLSANQLTVCGKRAGENYVDKELAYVTCPQCIDWMNPDYRSIFAYQHNHTIFRPVRMSEQKRSAILKSTRNSTDQTNIQKRIWESEIERYNV